MEDSIAIRKRLRIMLLDSKFINLVGEAGDAKQAITQIAHTKPDVLIVDLHLAEGTGLQVLKAVKQLLPTVRSIVLTNFANEQYRKASINAGAECFLDKSTEFEQVPLILEAWHAS